MRKELTMDNIRVNLTREYGTKPQVRASIEIIGGAVIAVLAFATGRLPVVILGLIFVVIGAVDLIKCRRMKAKILSDDLIVKEGRCIEKKLKPGTGGPKRYFYFTKNSYYLATNQDIRLWEKTQIGDKFYLVSFQNSKDIKKIYPESALKYTNK